MVLISNAGDYYVQRARNFKIDQTKKYFEDLGIIKINVVTNGGMLVFTFKDLLFSSYRTIMFMDQRKFALFGVAQLYKIFKLFLLK